MLQTPLEKAGESWKSLSQRNHKVKWLSSSNLQIISFVCVASGN